jgi:hypothetical protein
MRTAVKMSGDLHPVSDHPALAMFANGRHRLNRAFETVEYVPLSGRNYFKGFVILVAADFALGHMLLLGHGWMETKTPRTP